MGNTSANIDKPLNWPYFSHNLWLQCACTHKSAVRL